MRPSAARTIAGGVFLVLTACSGSRPVPGPCEAASPVAPSGCASATADLGGQSGMLPDYQGSWAGEYAITACHESGQLVGFCREHPVGASFPVALRFVQRRAAVEGSFTLGDLWARVGGTIDGSGTLSLTGADMRLEGLSVGLEAPTFNLASNGDLRGMFRTVWTRDGVAGCAGFNAELRFVSRGPTALGHRQLPHGATGRSRNMTG